VSSGFFDRTITEPTSNPNGQQWWQSPPLPDGRRVQGAHPDLDRQFKVFDPLHERRPIGPGDRVLDIGANDGFHSVAAALCGAAVTAINSADWPTYPTNIAWLSDLWESPVEILTGDFRTFEFDGQFDVVLCLGVIYHVENVFDCMRRLKSLMAPGGCIYLETHLSPVPASVPIWEAASDRAATSAPQGKDHVDMVGISNFLLPNALAIECLADTYGLQCEAMLDNAYCREDPSRGLFLLHL